MATNQRGSELQRREGWFGDVWWGDVWWGYVVDGKAVTAPVDIETLPPGEYRLARS